MTLTVYLPQPLKSNWQQMLLFVLLLPYKTTMQWLQPQPCREHAHIRGFVSSCSVTAIVPAVHFQITLMIHFTSSGSPAAAIQNMHTSMFSFKSLMAAWTNKPQTQFLCFSLIIKQDLKHTLQKMFSVSFYLTKLFQVCILKLSSNVSVINCIFRARNGQWLLHRTHQHLGLQLGSS